MDHLWHYEKTAEAVTPMPGLQYMFFTFTALYLFLAIMVSWLMYRQFRLFQTEEPTMLEFIIGIQAISLVFYVVFVVGDFKSRYI